MYLDRWVTCHSHIWNKTLNFNLKTNKLNWLLGHHLKLSVQNKLILYKVILKPIGTYGIQLWGTAYNSNIKIIQRYQSKNCRQIFNTPEHVTNQVRHRDTKTPSVREKVNIFSKRYKNKLEDHLNYFAINLLDNSVDCRYLRRYIQRTLDTVSISTIIVKPPLN